jgi:hypothetical protein
VQGGELTAREAEIIRQLLAKRGITDYEIIGATPEGKDLPGSTYDGEIELLSGTVVTATTAYSFWLDWAEGDYTFWHWREIDLNQALDKDEIVEAQQGLRQWHAHQ